MIRALPAVIVAILGALHSGCAIDRVRQQEPREITEFVNPITDGYVTQIVTHGETGITHVHGSGQAIWDGWGYRWTDGKGREDERLYILGPNSPFGKETGVWSEYPKLVDVVGDDLYAINVHTGEDFPSLPRERRSGVTGNVVLYNASEDRHENLTGLSGVSGKYAKALRWFADQEVLLIEISEKVRAVTFGRPVPGTGEPRCLHLPTRTDRPIEEYPEIERWYKDYRSIEVTREPLERPPDRIRWVITKSDEDARATYITPEMKGNLSVRFVEDSLVCVSHMRSGTTLIDIRTGRRTHVGGKLTVNIDYNSRQVVLRSRHSDINGQYRYWLRDLDPYIERIR